MSESAKHTPGPWTYEPTSGAIYFADGDVEPLIASTNLECVSAEQGDADGRLIAAAPDLLEAAKFAYAAMDSDEGRERARKSLIAAIAKATTP